MRPLHFLSRLLSITITSALPSFHPSPLSWSSTKHLIAFGDSYTYVQGTHGRQNYSFLGDLQDLAFTPAQLLSNRIVQNQTSTAEGGPNWVEHLTGCGLRPGLTSPRDCERQLWDFAFAGADVSTTARTPRHHDFTVSLGDQIGQFRASGAPALARVVDRRTTLVAFWIGINDVGDSAEEEEVPSFPALYDDIVGTWLAAVRDVAALGFQHFLLVNLPPLDRTPGNVGRAAGPRPNGTMIGWWDETLERHARKFREERRVDVRVFDANGFLNGVMDEAERYGIRNVTGYCPSYDQPYIDTDPAMYGCLPLDEYFWFNTGHMTSHVHQILAGAVETFLNS